MPSMSAHSTILVGWFVIEPRWSLNEVIPVLCTQHRKTLDKLMQECKNTIQAQSTGAINEWWKNKHTTAEAKNGGAKWAEARLLEHEITIPIWIWDLNPKSQRAAWWVFLAFVTDGSTDCAKAYKGIEQLAAFWKVRILVKSSEIYLVPIGWTVRSVNCSWILY